MGREVVEAGLGMRIGPDGDGLCLSRWGQEYKEELYKKYLNDPDNYDGVITHLEPDIMECEVKRALGSIAVSKASACDIIPVELFKTLKHDAIEIFHSICQQI